MAQLSMIAVLFSFELVAQAPGNTREWVVIESKEGGFSVAMPGRPAEQTQEIPTPIGKIVSKIYICPLGNNVLILQCQTHPRPLPQHLDLDELKAGIETGIKAQYPGQINMVSRKPITKGTRAGTEMVFNLSAPQGKNTVIVHFYTGADKVYAMIAIAAVGEPIPPEAEDFFNSLRFDGKPAVKPAMAKVSPVMAKATATAVARPAPVKRQQIGKIDRVDTTAESALRTFMMAMAAGDEETLREVTLSNPDFDWLLRGEATPVRGIKELKQQIIKARVDRLKEGDRVKMTGKEVHVIRAAEVGRDRAALKIEGTPGYAPLERVKGHWKVDPAPFIAARKAAAGAK